jgi:hypothetical protein
MIFSDKKILIISPEPWGVNHISKHHYALALIKKGNTVYFLNPPAKTDRINEIEERLYIIDYKLPLRGANRLPYFFANIINKISAAKILKLANTNFENVFSFDPFRFQNPSVFGKNLTKIYYAADLHHTPQERILIANCQLTVSVSKSILARFEVCKQPLQFINHAISETFAEKARERLLKDEQNELSSDIKCGYVGNLLSRYIDYESLIDIVASNPKVKFYFIGPYQQNNLGGDENEFASRINTLKSLENVNLMGSRKPAEVCKIIQDMDMFLMTYNADKYPAEVSNSHKLMEYLSTGKTIVANRTMTYESASHKDLIIMSESNHQLPKLFQETIEKLDDYNSPLFIKKRIKFALENTYSKQIEKLEQYFSTIGQ